MPEKTSQLSEVQVKVGWLPDVKVYTTYFPGPDDSKYIKVGENLVLNDENMNPVNWMPVKIEATGVDPMELSSVRLEFKKEGTEAVEYVKLDKGDLFLRQSDASPELFKWLSLPQNVGLTPGYDKVDQISGIPLGEAPKVMAKEVLERYRKKILACSELLADIFVFPNTNVSTLFFASWLADGARVILRGVPGSGKSIDGKDRVLCKWKGRIFTGPISEIVDTLLNRAFDDGTLQIVGDSYIARGDFGVEVPSLDTQTGKMSWSSVNEFSRHTSSGRMVRVTTRGGSIVTATKDHSFLVGRGGKIVTEKGDSVIVGDFVPLLKELNVPTRDTIRVSDYLTSSTHLVGDVVRNLMEGFDGSPTPYQIQEYLPDGLAFSPSAFRNWVLGTRPVPERGRVYTLNGKLDVGLNDEIRLTETFGAFLGAFISEGSSSRNMVSITTTDKGFADRSSRWILETGHNFNDVPDKRTGAVFSRRVLCDTLASFCRTVCGAGSRNKKIPDFAYDAPLDFVKALLREYFEGDGWVCKEGQVSAMTASKDLARGISLLLKRFGIPSTVRSHSKGCRYKGEMVIGIYHSVTIPGRFGKVFADKVDLPKGRNMKERNGISIFDKVPVDSSFKTSRLGIQTKDVERGRVGRERYEKLLGDSSMTTDDFWWDEVVGVEEVEGSKWVYDLGVPNKNTFATMDGVIVHNTTLVESSSILMMSDPKRFSDAQFYYKTNFMTEAELLAMKIDIGFAKYKVGDKPVAMFGAREYLNMYRKHWGRCPMCSKPATVDDKVTTRVIPYKPVIGRELEKAPSYLVHYLRCSYENCPGKKEPFNEDIVKQVGDAVSDPIEPDESKYDEWGFDADNRAFPKMEDAEKFLAHSKTASNDYYWVECIGTSCRVRRASNAEGYVFSCPNFEPLLGVAKITPKKRPEEIFYYTDIEKEISDVSGEGHIKGRERFVMPPRARPIVKANVKFFNEFNRCLKPDTKVLLRDGGFVPIDSIIPGDVIAGYARGYGSEWVEVETKSVHSFERALEFQLVGGHRLVMSPDHHCVVFEDGVFVHKKADALRKGDEFVQAEFSPVDKKKSMFTEEPVIYLPVDSVKEVIVKEGYLVDIGVADLTMEGHESDHVFLAESLVLTGNSRPEVQDEVLGLLEEGEVEYKGESFYSNTPFIAFFDLNPHKEQTETVLDWAFYDRLDVELTLPTMNFGNKVELLTTKIDLRQTVFDTIMTNVCADCGSLVFRDETSCPPPPRGCGGHNIVEGVTPVFMDELNDIRTMIKESVVFSDDALITLAILSDMYGRCYFRYVNSGPGQHPLIDMRMKDAGLSKSELVDPFVDSSTVQWWPKFKMMEGTGIEVTTSETAAREGGAGNEKLFMLCTGGGLERPLGFRVCSSVKKMAMARAWFLTMTNTIKVGSRAKSLNPLQRLPRMVKMVDTDDEIKSRRIAKKTELLRAKVHPRAIHDEIRAIKKEVWYRLEECPQCGAPTTTSGPLEKDKKFSCKSCDYSFYPVFQVVVRPQDIIAVFPYSASMRFCADYNGNFIPDAVWKKYPNVVDWLRDEIGHMCTDANGLNPQFRELVDACKTVFQEATDTCKRTDWTPDKRKEVAIEGAKKGDPSCMTSSDYQKRAKNYPFYYQGIAYIAAVAGGKNYSDRWPQEKDVKVVVQAGKPAVSEFGVTFEGKEEKTGRKQDDWDVPPEPKKKPKKKA